MKLSSTESNLIVSGHAGKWPRWLNSKIGHIWECGHVRRRHTRRSFHRFKGSKTRSIVWGCYHGDRILRLASRYETLQFGVRKDKALTQSTIAYEAGAHSVHLFWLCLFATFTGIGGCASFAGAIKTCENPPILRATFYIYLSIAALNWPNHRGSATAFPLAAFGLSAFFFATISSLAFEDETGQFLLLLAIGTFAMCFVGFFFLRVVPHPQSYQALPESARRHSQSTQLTRSISGDRKRHSRCFEEEPGTQPIAVDENISSHGGLTRNSGSACEPSDVHERAADETSSLISDSSFASTPGDISSQNHEDEAAGSSSSHHPDIRGFAMIPRAEFWQLFLLMGLLTGVGLMTIK